MENHSALPDSAISGGGLLSRAFIDLELSSFQQACRWVQELPYGYNSDRDELRGIELHTVLRAREEGLKLLKANPMLLAPTACASRSNRSPQQNEAEGDRPETRSTGSEHSSPWESSSSQASSRCSKQPDFSTRIMRNSPHSASVLTKPA